MSVLFALRRLLLPFAIALGVIGGAPAFSGPGEASASAGADPPTAQARAKKKRAVKRPARKAKKTPRNRGKRQTVLRPDRGGPITRSPINAKVATGERTRSISKGKGRTDPSQLPLDEQIALQIEELLHGPLKDGTTSLFVADADTGKPVFSVYPDDPLNPASNVKLISTAATLDILGPEFTYVTRILGQSPDDDGVVTGDLYLLGSYDPTLTRTAIAGMAKQLHDSGVRRFDGDVVVGGTATRDGIFRSWGEITVVAGLPGEAPTASITSPSDFIQVEVVATTSKRRKVKAAQGIKVATAIVTDELGHQRMKITVSGTIAKENRVVREIHVKERSQHAAHILRGALRDLGVEVSGDVHIAEVAEYVDASLHHAFLPVPLAEHRSQRLADIVARVNKRSTNWLADRLIMTAAARKYRTKPSMEVAINAMYSWLQARTGLDRDHVTVDSGSGLSYKTSLSARQVVTVLRVAMGLEGVIAARDEKIQQAYRDSLAIGGKDGTIRGRFKALRGTVHGKTGTLSRVVALAGTVEIASGRKLVFSIITNGHDPKFKGRVRTGHEQLVSLLCDYLHRLPRPAGAEPEIEIEPEVLPVEDDVEIDAEDEVEVEIDGPTAAEATATPVSAPADLELELDDADVADAP